MSESETFLEAEHDICAKTNFCKKCGCHEIVIQEQGLLCQYATNSIAISHIRAASRAEDAWIASAAAEHVPTADIEITFEGLDEAIKNLDEALNNGDIEIIAEWESEEYDE